MHAQIYNLVNARLQKIIDWYGFISDVSDEFKSELAFCARRV